MAEVNAPSSLSTSSSSATPVPAATASSTCLYHSKRWRPAIEHLMNLLRKQKCYRPLPLSPLTCTCQRPDSALATATTPSDPQRLLLSLPENLSPARTVLESMLTTTNQSVAASNLVLAIQSLVAPAGKVAKEPAASAEVPVAATEPAPEPADSVTITSGDKEAPPVNGLMEEFRVPIAEQDMGVFISRSGFTHLIPKVGEKIRVHYAGHDGNEALLQVTAVTKERIQVVKAALEKHAVNVTAARKRHRKALIDWSVKTRQRAEERRRKVLSREETEHRFLAKIQYAYSNVSQVNTKMVATSHYQRDQMGRNCSKSIETRKAHRMGGEEKKALHDENREKTMCCGNCHRSFSEDLAAAPCRYHSGYLLNKGKGRITWSCCGLFFKERGKHTENDVGRHLTGCEVAGKHAWRTKKAAVHLKKVDQPKGTVLLQIALE